MVRIAKEAEIECTVKMLVALPIGLALATLMGWRGSLTIAFAMILISYTNRGIHGAGAYYRTRMQTQLMICIVIYFTLTPLQHFFDLPEWVTIILLTIPMNCLFLYLFIRYQFTPIILTGVVSPLMVLTYTLRDESYIFLRLVFTFTGLALGFLVAFVYPTRGKLTRAEGSLKNLSGFFAGELTARLAAESPAPTKEYQAQTKNFTYELQCLASYLGIVRADVDTMKYKPCAGQVKYLTALEDGVKAQQEALAFLAQSAALLQEDAAFYQDFKAALSETAGRHAALTDAGKEAPAQQTDTEQLIRRADSRAKVSAAAVLTRYKRKVDALAALKPGKEAAA